MIASRYVNVSAIIGLKLVLGKSQLKIKICVTVYEVVCSGWPRVVVRPLLHYEGCGGHNCRFHK